MSGLLLSLAPFERFIVNGAVLENGDRPSRIRIKDNDARVLRCSDAMKPGEIDTPVKQVYYAIQLMITGDLQPENVLQSLREECDRLVDVFEIVAPTVIPVLRSMIDSGNYYSALCHLRQVLKLEAELLFAKQGLGVPPANRKVA
ncbi:MAG: flagellar biosynthesis repressor FlbT [Henriciella sp.]